MTNMRLFSLLVLYALANCLHPIIVGGNMLWDSVTGERFYVKGIAYGYAVEDSYENFWKPAMDHITELGFNTVRVYTTDPNIDVDQFHVTGNTYDKFMAYAESKGLYVIVPLTPASTATWQYCVLNRGATPSGDNGGCYPWCLLTYGENVVTTFSKYPNTLMFTIGNEVMNTDVTWPAGPCVKGYIADVKRFMKKCHNNLRYVPLMYAAADNGMPDVDADDSDLLKAEYFTCGEEETRVDVFGVNIYRWCSNETTFASSGYSHLTQKLLNIPAPVILSEFGCAEYYYVAPAPDRAFKGQRQWHQLNSIFGHDMSDVVSGAVAYSYGVEGGPDFAFFTGGTANPRGSPGYDKVKGPPGNSSCTDNYEHAIVAVHPPKVKPQGKDLCHWEPPGYTPVVPDCPQVLYDKYHVDKNIPTRVVDPPFIKCPTRQLSPEEEAIDTCTQITTAPTTQAPTAPTAPMAPTAPTAPTTAPTTPAPTSPTTPNAPTTDAPTPTTPTTNAPTTNAPTKPQAPTTYAPTPLPPNVTTTAAPDNKNGLLSTLDIGLIAGGGALGALAVFSLCYFCKSKKHDGYTPITDT